VLVGDSQSGKIGQLSSEAFTEWGNTMRGLLDGPPIHMDRRRLFMKRFELDVESGIGLSQAAQQQVSSYTADPVTITCPTVLTRAAADAGGNPLPGLDANYPSALLSVWLNLSDADAGGITFGNAGLAVTINTDALQSPQVVVNGWDADGAFVVTAAYSFSGWSDWVNVMVSVDTTTQQLQVWCNTLVASVLVETELTADALTWSSREPLNNAAGGSWTLTALCGGEE
jgi:hypothetical protein